MQNPVRCFHCTEAVPKGGHFQLSINQQLHEFCCPACLAITETIHGAGLDHYYQSRNTHAEKPSTHHFEQWDNPQLQSEFVQRDEKNAEHVSAALYIEGMHCTACAWLIEQQLKKIDGINHCQVNYQDQRLQLNWHEKTVSLSHIMQTINNIGYIPHPFIADTIAKQQKKQHKKQLIRIGITALLMMQIGMLAIALYAGDFLGMDEQYRHLLKVASLFFSLPLLYFSALPFFISAIKTLTHRRINMDVNIALAIAGLYGSSIYSIYSRSGDIYFDSVAMLCLFILIARFIEFSSRNKCYQAQGLLPKTACKVTDNKHQELPLSDIHIGDQLLIKSGQTIPLDGTVVEGISSVSEAMINGEAKAAQKSKGDSVFAGSQNHDGQLIITVSQEAKHCLVNKITELAQQQSSSSTPMQSLDNKIAAGFTSLVLLLAVASYVFWFNAGNLDAFWVALSVLVISCPCALSLAAPTALSAAHYRLRQQGLLIRSTHVLPTLNKITDVIFDKTGTLTHGQVQLTSTILCNNTDEHYAQQLAAALEAHSQHPISHAFSTSPWQATDIRMHTGLGIEGMINASRYRIGSAAFCRQWLPNLEEPDSGKMQIALCNEQHCLAWFQLEDSIRLEAKILIPHLQQEKLQLHIFSGDSSNDVDHTACALHIDKAYKNCSSEDKLKRLQTLQQHGAITLMVGDGINDAPTLKKSHISVAFFNSSDWLKNQADVILLNNDLSKIQHLLIYAKAYQSIYRQNFSWALLYNAVAIPFAMAGWVTPMIAAIGMSLSSIAVVLNSQRLLKKNIIVKSQG